MPYEGLSLQGQTALVTGSGRGIGAALAVGLAQAGADVAVSDRPDRLDLAEETKDKVKAEGVKSAGLCSGRLRPCEYAQNNRSDRE